MMSVPGLSRKIECLKTINLAGKTLTDLYAQDCVPAAKHNYLK
jgi:hypothetical protein